MSRLYASNENKRRLSIRINKCSYRHVTGKYGISHIFICKESTCILIQLIQLSE